MRNGSCEARPWIQVGRLGWAGLPGGDGGAVSAAAAIGLQRPLQTLIIFWSKIIMSWSDIWIKLHCRYLKKIPTTKWRSLCVTICSYVTMCMYVHICAYMWDVLISKYMHIHAMHAQSDIRAHAYNTCTYIQYMHIHTIHEHTAHTCTYIHTNAYIHTYTYIHNAYMHIPINMHIHLHACSWWHTCAYICILADTWR